MTTPFLGEIQIFGFPFAPYQWALANGTLIAIQQNSTLFSLIGTYYGGNGTTNFQLPNLMGRAPCNHGTGIALSPRSVGETFGEFNVALTTSSMPSHAHTMVATSPPTGVTPVAVPTEGAELARFANTSALVANNPTPNTTLSPSTVVIAGGSVPHPNQQPFLGINFCIALAGAYPSFG